MLQLTQLRPETSLPSSSSSSSQHPNFSTSALMTAGITIPNLCLAGLVKRCLITANIGLHREWLQLPLIWSVRARQSSSISVTMQRQRAPSFIGFGRHILKACPVPRGEANIMITLNPQICFCFCPSWRLVHRLNAANGFPTDTPTESLLLTIPERFDSSSVVARVGFCEAMKHSMRIHPLLTSKQTAIPGNRSSTSLVRHRWPIKPLLMLANAA
jgi:hypothetical protein